MVLKALAKGLKAITGDGYDDGYDLGYGDGFGKLGEGLNILGRTGTTKRDGAWAIGYPISKAILDLFAKGMGKATKSKAGGSALTGAILLGIGGVPYLLTKLHPGVRTALTVSKFAGAGGAAGYPIAGTGLASIGLAQILDAIGYAADDDWSKLGSKLKDLRHRLSTGGMGSLKAELKGLALDAKDKARDAVSKGVATVTGGRVQLGLGRGGSKNPLLAPPQFVDTRRGIEQQGLGLRSFGNGNGNLARTYSTYDDKKRPVAR